MTCQEVREALLSVDLTELTGEGDGQLAQHLESCMRCRGAAQAVLDAEADLATELSVLVPEPNLDLVIQEGMTPSAERVRRWAGPTRLGFLKTALPVALAAGLAGILMLREPSLPGKPFVAPDRSATFEVEPAPDQNVMVLATKDPTITVVWLF